MKLVSYRTREAFAGEPGRADNLGVVLAGAVVPASALGEHVAASMSELLLDWPASLEAIAAAVAGISDPPPRMLSFEQIELLAPVPRPGKIVCAGVNYQAHASEGGRDAPEQPVLFAKMTTSVIGHGGQIRWSPELTQAVDYEAELAVVIGRTARRISVGEALEYVCGYTCLNDVSARDLQFADRQFVRGKSLDTFCPIGPWLVTSDEIPDPQDLRVRCIVNGETLQDASTSEMVASVAQLVSFCSQAFTLEPGDVIATGTPSGVGWYREPRVLLRTVMRSLSTLNESVAS
jgi:2-keto-4-pentenoate hydratase/2-oxohepta-3-ene-1,7-dioic acid hydratase in catechol pathway